MNDYKLKDKIDSITEHMAMVVSNHKNVIGETPTHLYASSYGGQETVVQAVTRRIRELDMFEESDFLNFYAGYIAHRPDSPYAIY